MKHADLQKLLKRKRTTAQPTPIIEQAVEPATSKREAVLKRLEGIQPIKPFEFKTKPFPHQIEGYNYGLKYNNVLLADEQGLGKTKQSIDIAVARKQEANKCLIICGVNSVKYNWSKEVEIHSNEKAYVIDANSSEKRYYQIDEWINGDIYFGVINIESLRKVEILKKLSSLTQTGVINLVIIDEIHKAKNGNSQQGKAIRLLQSKYKIGLTGTPLMNNALDLWNILSWLGAEWRNFWAFRKQYCELGGFNNQKVVGHKNEKELFAKLNKVMLRRKKDDVLDLPPKIHQIEYVELKAKQRKLYNQLRLGLLEQIEDIVLNPNPLTSMIRLRQITGGVLGDDNPKLDRLKELLEEEIIPNGHKVIIFSQWSKVTEKLKEELKKYKPAYVDGNTKDRMNQVERFQNDDKCKIIIGTIGAMGTGLTLNKASYVVFMDKAWTPADNEQAEDRAHRIGTTKTVNIISLVAQGTIDEKIEYVLETKRDVFDRLVEGKSTGADQRELLEMLLSD